MNLNWKPEPVRLWPRWIRSIRFGPKTEGEPSVGARVGMTNDILIMPWIKDDLTR